MFQGSPSLKKNDASTTPKLNFVFETTGMERKCKLKNSKGISTLIVVSDIAG